MMGFRFQDPWWLLLLVPLAVLGWQLARRRPAAVLYSDVQLLRSLPRTSAQRLRRWMAWFGLAGIVLMTIALARPQRGRTDSIVRAEGIAIEMCIDRSGSMRAMDFEIDGRTAERLAVVKKVFGEFVVGGDGLPGRPNDMIGLVDFGGYAQATCPLTLDHGALMQTLAAVAVPEMTADASGQRNVKLYQEDLSTAIGDALALSVDRLRSSKAKSKVVVLLSDGESNAGVIAPAEAAEAAKKFGVKVYTIGIGTTGVVPMPAVDPFGNKVLVRQPVRIDEKTLQEIAETTGGRYFNAQDAEALKKVYAEIDKLEKTEVTGRRYTDYRDLYEYALLPGLMLIFVQVVLVSTRFRSLP